MIDWQVQVRGADPPGWDQHRDGCWFPDFDHQEFLLPYFDVGDIPIDPYGGTEFREPDLQRLREHLRAFRYYVEAKPETWSISESSPGQERTIRLERQKILMVIDRTLEMIEIALRRGGTLIFRGD